MKRLTRRTFVKGATAASATFAVVPPHVLGRGDRPAPSDTLGGALIGSGGRGPGTFRELSKGFENVQMLARCDVKFVGKEDNNVIYSDFRRVLERKDIDMVAIATPPHWHALISIAAAEAGKDVLCEKPMTHTIAEGRAVVNAFKRYRRIFQIGTFGRFGASRDKKKILIHKIMRSGLLNPNPGVHHHRGGLKVKQWSGKVTLKPENPPANLDWNMYVGPCPMKEYVRERVGGTHRNYWDYEGGGLTDMGQHKLDPINWLYGKDDTSPVKIVPHAPVAHPEVTGMWGWCEMTYADGFTLIMESKEWGEPYSRKKAHRPSLDDLSEENRKKIEAMPDPAPLKTFSEAVKTRQPAGAHPEAAHRTCTLLHLINIAIRTGRTLHYDPVRERFIGDDAANRYIEKPMRAPWRVEWEG